MSSCMKEYASSVYVPHNAAVCKKPSMLDFRFPQIINLPSKKSSVTERFTTNLEELAEQEDGPPRKRFEVFDPEHGESSQPM